MKILLSLLLLSCIPQSPGPSRVHLGASSQEVPTLLSPDTTSSPRVSLLSDPPATAKSTFKWTELSPTGGARKIFVSSSTGSDLNDGLAPERPVQTLSKGISLLRSGQPDWLYLKSGDQFSGGLGTWRKSGLSTAAPMVITSYGEGARPILLSGTTHIFYKAPGRVDHLFFLNLDFYNQKKDPGHQQFDSSFTGVNFMWVGDGSDVLVENCSFRFGGIVVQSGGAGNPGNFRFRRNVVYNSYSTSGHNQGIYTSHVDKLLLEENIFDHNGWLPEVPGAEATMFNHNAYISETSELTIVRNLFLRASSMGIKMRSDVSNGSHHIVIDDNFFYEGEIGVGIGGNTNLVKRFQNASVSRNVFFQIGKGTPTGRSFSWGIEITDVLNGIFQENYFIDMDDFSNTFAIRLTGTSNENLLIQGNIFDKVKPSTIKNEATASGPNNQILDNNSVNHPIKDLTTFLQSIGESTSPNARDRFINIVHSQQKSLWREEFSAQSINNYFRK